MKEYIIRCENNKFTIKGEIVHCKDCEFCIVEEPISRGIIPDMYCRICRIWGSNVRTDDYCSYGEKQVTGKLNNPDDSLLTEDAEACKEQKSKLESEKLQLSPETSTNDCISRKQAIEAVANVIWHFPNECYQDLNDYGVALALVTDALAGLPPVTPTERTGEWVSLFDGNEWFIHCSKCKTQHYEEDLLMGGSELPDFCPSCGADMRGEE